MNQEETAKPAPIWAYLLQAPWFFTLPEFASKHEEAVQSLASGRALLQNR